MSKFGLDSASQTTPKQPANDLSEKLASFAPSNAKLPVAISELDAAAKPHGFVSREGPSLRRRRTASLEPKRHLSFMIAESEYNRFIQYADRHRLTYHDAISRLLDHVND